MSAKNVDSPEYGSLKHLEYTCIGVGILGVLVIALGVGAVWGAGWGPSLLAPGAAIVVASLTSYVAVKSVVSWREQRVRDREHAEYRHREEVYEEIASFMLGRFIEGQEPYDLGSDARLRTLAALWASSDVVRALGAWQSEIKSVLDRAGGATGRPISLTDKESARLKSCFGESLIAMRVDLGSRGKAAKEGKQEILRSIFNE